MEGETPHGVITDSVLPRAQKMHEEKKINLGGELIVNFDPKEHLIMHKEKSLVIGLAAQ